jgi:hypothetical protein
MTRMIDRRGSEGRRVAAGIVVLAAALGVAVATPVAAQPRRGLPPAAADAAQDPAPSPGEVNRLFDAYVVMQAQEQLGLDDAHFGPFVTRLRALQEVRRRHVRDRAAAVQELRRLLQGPGNEPLLRERLDALARLDAAAQADSAKAMAAVDELLDVRQRARYRVLEQQLEIRKLELVGRARQRLRQRNP